MRLVTIADIHCRVDTPYLVDDLLGEAIKDADILLLGGDLTDTGLPAEAQALARQLRRIPIPIIGVLGNHDHQSGCPEEISHILVDGGVNMLDGQIIEMDGVAFAGTKGFCGGFDENLVQPFGEQALKAFIRASMDETIQLGQLLSRSKAAKKVTLLHYAPIRGTLQGEPAEIFPFLGTSRLAEAVDRYGSDVIFHGHSHHGYPDGFTARKIPVYNVCRFVLQRFTGNPYRIYDL